MYKNTTPDRVRQVRRFFKLKQRDLAALLGVSRRTVIRFEQRGGYIPSLESDRLDGDAWRDLEARFDAAGANFGSPADVAIAREALQKLSPPAGARPREVTKRPGPKLRKTVTRPIGRRARSRKTVTRAGRGDKSRSRSVTRRGGRRRRGRGRR